MKALSATIFAIAVGVLNAQAPPVFEVASIRQSAPDQLGGNVQYLPGGRFTVTNVQLVYLIQDLWGVRDFQIVNAPKWTTDWSTSRFDIQAKAPESATNDQLRVMARTLLADRFQLKVHRETRELPVYALVTDKNGPKLRIAKDNGKPRGSGGIASMTRGWIQGTNVPLSSIVEALTRRLDRPVVDKTNFAEPVDFSLKWSPDQGADDTLPSIFVAVQEQLGLRLELQKLPIEVLVIDHVEKPSEN